MPIGPGGLDANGVWQYGEDDTEALASDLLNLGMASVSTEVGLLDAAVAAITGGKILQVVSTTKTDTFTQSIASGAYTGDVTGLTAVITPAFTTSLILVSYSIVVVSQEDGAILSALYRNGSAIAIGAADGSRAQATAGTRSSSQANTVDTISTQTLDAPSSTSALTYSVRVGHVGVGTNIMYVNRSERDSNTYSDGRYTSTITAMEVAG